MILSGILLSPNGEPLASTSVRLIAAITSAQVLQSIQSVIVTGVNGEYSLAAPMVAIGCRLPALSECAI